MMRARRALSVFFSHEMNAWGLLTKTDIGDITVSAGAGGEGVASGTLEQSFDRIAESAAGRFQHRLQLFEQFSFRLTAALVIFAICGTAMRLVSVVSY
jgi:hypothetical protein